VNSLNDENNKLNAYITGALSGLNYIIRNPFFAYNPFNYFKIKENQNSITKLREYARECILKRIKDMESGDFATSDILSIIFKTASTKIDNL
jgi:hypothetical protein